MVGWRFFRSRYRVGSRSRCRTASGGGRRSGRSAFLQRGADSAATSSTSCWPTSGWKVGPDLTSTHEVKKEVEVSGQPTDSGIGYADYVLVDDNDKPLAVIEAKKTSKNAEIGRTQAKCYADGLEAEHGQRPVIFYTNGYDLWIWNDAGR